MSRIRQTDTEPELMVRRALHAMGKRFRLHRRDLPGSPDIILPRHSIAVFVHGCFWHRHPGCRRASTPKANSGYWADKFEANVARDARAETELTARDWRVVVIWECETKRPEELAAVLAQRLFDQE